MNLRTWVIVLGVVGAVAWLGQGAFSEDEPKPGGAGAADMEKLMEELATPGEMHAWMAKFDGTWDVDCTFHEMDGTVLHEKATATFRMILGGRWSEQVFDGTYKGKSFDGRGITGYDNAKKEFANYWFDTMSTGTAPATGSRSEDGKTLTLVGVWTAPGMAFPFRYVTTWVDENEFTFQIVMGEGGQDTVFGEMTYTRK